LIFNLFPVRPLLDVCSSAPNGAQKVAQKSRTDNRSFEQLRKTGLPRTA
jgi:hypothetical protein